MFYGLSLARILTASLAVSIMCVAPLRADAYTECTLTPYRYYLGDQLLWVNFSEGGVGTISRSNPDFNSIHAIFLAAITTQRTLTVRYVADGVSCSSQQTITGVWIGS
jgi:hypothetical protein